MNEQIKTAFTPINVRVTKAHALQVAKMLLAFELRDDHPDTLNTSLLGVHNIHFLPKDVQQLFTIFQVDYLDVEDIIKNCSAIDRDFKVSSDAYNLFTIYLMHRTLCSTELNAKEKEDLMVWLCTLLHYKFFSSIVNYNFPYGADQATMEATIEGLSLKYDIKHPETNTWRLIMIDRSRDVVNRNSIHYKTLQNFVPDKSVLYVITDIQTRLRAKLRLVINEYYINKENKKKIDSYQMVNDVDGDKLIHNLAGTYDAMVAGLCTDVLNANRFINTEYVTLTCKLCTGLREDLLKTTLMKFSILSMTQNNKKQSEKVILAKDKKTIEFYEGYRILLTHIIQDTYQTLTKDRSVNLKSKLSILEKTIDIYRSSRTADPNILLIKDSVERFVKLNGDTKREQTIINLKIGFIIYIILMSFNYM